MFPKGTMCCPDRFFDETIYNKYGEPRALDKEAFLEWRKKLYLSYDLTPNGIPPRDLLKKVGLDFVIPTLEKRTSSRRRPSSVERMEC